MSTWHSDDPPAPERIAPTGWALVFLRASALAIWIGALFGLHMLVRVVERPLAGQRRPLSPWITVAVCRGVLRILGLGWTAGGPHMSGAGALVANHATWLDIFVLNAARPICFVSKSEVAGWPGIGLLARATGTVFIRRDRRDAAAQQALLESRLRAGQRLLFFPEGTSTDTLRVLPFKPTLFAAFFAPSLGPAMQVQPVSVVYHPAPGAEPRFYGWWGDMEIGRDMVKHLATRRPGAAELVFHPPLRVADFADRKSLARAAETAVRRGLAARRPETAGA